MRKHILTLTAVFALGTVLFTGCNKDDTTAPEITLLGDNPFMLKLNTPYADPGATADDNTDGDLSSSIVVDVSDVNKDQVGDYTVHYSVTDAAGNVGDEYRTVTVYNELPSSAFTGSYSCTITTGPGSPYSYNDGLVISGTVNNAVAWNKFGDYSNATGKLNMLIVGSSITIPNQSFTCGSPTPVLRQFGGSGTIVGNGSPGTTVTLIIDETVNGNTDHFTYVFTKL